MENKKIRAEIDSNGNLINVYENHNKEYKVTYTVRYTNKGREYYISTVYYNEGYYENQIAKR